MTVNSYKIHMQRNNGVSPKRGNPAAICNTVACIYGSLKTRCDKCITFQAAFQQQITHSLLYDIINKTFILKRTNKLHKRTISYISIPILKR